MDISNEELNRIHDPVKMGTWFFEKYEKKLLRFVLPRIPKFIEPYHLVWMTLVWSIFILVFSILAKSNIKWLWGFSVTILLQMLTDMMDGSLGRYRKTGLVIWGTFVDHLLDMVFLCSIVIGYFLIADFNLSLQFLVLLSLLCCLMYESVLYFAATRELHISIGGIGVAEIRMLPIFINLLIMYFSSKLLPFIINFLVIITAFVFIVGALKLSGKTWSMDMKNKSEKGS